MCTCLFVKCYLPVSIFVSASGSKYLLDVIKPSPTQQQEIYREKTGFDPILFIIGSLEVHPAREAY